MYRKLISCVMGGLFLFSVAAHACIHVPFNYPQEVIYDTEEIFMYHDGQYANMIIKPTIKVEGEDLPNTIGWIIPVQSVPVSYKEVDSNIFNALFSYIRKEKQKRYPNRMIAQGLGREKGLIFHEKQFVGHYEIQPIELTDDKSGKELLDWFDLNGFKTKNKDIDYYLARNYVYLAVKIFDIQNAKEELKPLHIVYKSDELSVPLKFDSLSGIFNVKIYFISNKKILNKDMFDSKHLILDGDWEDSLEFDPKQTGSSLLDELNLPKGYIYRFEGWGINSSSNQLKDWSEDPTIKN